MIISPLGTAVNILQVSMVRKPMKLSKYSAVVGGKYG